MYVCRRCSLYSLSERLPDISVFFFNDTATTEIYTLSLHDALPIFTLGSIDRLQGSSSRRERRHCRQSARSRATDGRSGKLDHGWSFGEHTRSELSGSGRRRALQALEAPQEGSSNGTHRRSISGADCQVSG